MACDSTWFCSWTFSQMLSLNMLHQYINKLFFLDLLLKISRDFSTKHVYMIFQWTCPDMLSLNMCINSLLKHVHWFCHSTCLLILSLNNYQTLSMNMFIDSVPEKLPDCVTYFVSTRVNWFWPPVCEVRRGKVTCSFPRNDQQKAHTTPH